MPDFDIWTSELSPFSIKTQTCLEFSGYSYRRLPREGGRLESLWLMRRIRRAKKRKAIVRYPSMSPLDEYPLVPILIGPGRKMQFDSSAISRWLDAQSTTRARLWPDEPGLGFLAQLIDDAFDEFFLYILHHQRWSVSARTTDAGERLYEEFGHLPFTPAREEFARSFARRQVRRLPYMLSVAPDGYGEDLPAHLMPPRRPGWPDTHTLQMTAWHRYLDALDQVLRRRPWLLGERFCIADASVYGSFGAILYDKTSASDLAEKAPALYAWAKAMQSGSPLPTTGDFCAGDEISALLHVICDTFVSLMRQNEAAYQARVDRGTTDFNEQAMRSGQSSYSGRILGHQFRMVVKTFQVRVWRDLVATWCDLANRERLMLTERFPCLACFDEAAASKS